MRIQEAVAVTGPTFVRRWLERSLVFVDEVTSGSVEALDPPPPKFATA
jgi:hypothetical protein